ncbi:hypothetical protein RRV45_14055 [Bacillus sp. DTU_2020_1000418_1_SI_GHA_SEK_038]|uniref:hypothetical protein n=1 Tax=Bacillus sp. DTU_2020_1000418_1_SI_GHA_SEK_038 TaxID=3077585 RepID=UPI0028ECDA67|nr:hypothetical protein [Bacillus sp. DTU_2020_1000418_1_SI_GHA_SEK_038]WNS74039.1 hypothetical protein RRV45_14055 [Bacillus sp. DTU_2020_1000418_1_SI_GHA_SEK_038]
MSAMRQDVAFLPTSRSQANPPRKGRTPFREARLVLVGAGHKGMLLRLNIAGTIVL